MRIAYIISAYKLPQQLVRLVQRLDAPGASFFIHVDRKTSWNQYMEMTEPLKQRFNVYFLPRHRCDWGGFGHVEASLKGLWGLKDKGIEFDYAILLTGQDYPIKSNAQIHEHLAKGGGRSYLEYFPLPHPEWPGNGGLDRLKHWHFYPFGRHIEYPVKSPWQFHRLNRMWDRLVAVIPADRSLPNGVNPFGGSSYWCLSRECVDYINRFLFGNKRYVRYFKHTWVSDELFFQTILLNSGLENRLVNDNLWYIQWTQGQPSPDVLSAHHFEALARSGKLFARKFDATVDSEILDMIDRRLLGCFSS
jgi:hypothetical protein